MKFKIKIDKKSCEGCAELFPQIVATQEVREVELELATFHKGETSNEAVARLEACGYILEDGMALEAFCKRFIRALLGHRSIVSLDKNSRTQIDDSLCCPFACYTVESGILFGACQLDDEYLDRSYILVSRKPVK